MSMGHIQIVKENTKTLCPTNHDSMSYSYDREVGSQWGLLDNFRDFSTSNPISITRKNIK